MSDKKKKKKPKITYIDDGSTIADMSGTSRLGAFGTRTSDPLKIKKRSTFKEQWTTYFQAVRMMILPMFIMIGIICVAFLIAWLVF